MSNTFFMQKLLIILLVGLSTNLFAQNQSPVSISGNMGISYEGYGLTVNPKTPSFYTPRRPWNQVRFTIAPQIKIGNFSLPAQYGIDWTNIKTLSRVKEAHHVMRTFLDDGAVTYDGEFYKYSGLFTFARPVQEHLPLLIGAMRGPRSFEVAGEVSDGPHALARAQATVPSDPWCPPDSFWQPHGLLWHTLSGVMALCLFFYWREDRGGTGRLPLGTQ